MLINKNQNINLSKARKARFLCLSSISLCVLAGGMMLNSSSVQAQNDPVYTTSNLGGNAGQNEIRLQQMENQIRQLTGKVEEQLYEINSLKQKVKLLETSPQGSMASQNAPPQNAPTQMGTSQRQATQNPLGLDLQAQDPKRMQTKSVISPNMDATQKYENAYADLKRGDFETAQKGFDEFLAQHGDHVLAANAKYWLGETYYVRGQYKKAARVFAEGFQAFPESAKSPDILLKLGMSLKGLNKRDDACVALGQVAVKFPVGNDSVIERADQERKSLSCES